MEKDNKKYCTLFIVRHGETEWNVKKLFQGQKDSQLTQKGLEQASLVAKKFQDIAFDAIFSSDLLRAKKTAEIIALEHALAVQTSKRIRERSFGSLEGINVQDRNNRFNQLFATFQALTDEEKFRFKFADEESDEEISTRFITFLREVAVGYAGKTILVVSHSGIMRTFLMRIGFGAYSELPSGCIENTGYIKLVSDGVDFFLQEAFGVHKVRQETK